MSELRFHLAVVWHILRSDPHAKLVKTSVIQRKKPFTSREEFVFCQSDALLI